MLNSVTTSRRRHHHQGEKITNLYQFPGGEFSVTWEERQLRTQRFHVIALVLAESIGGDDPETVAFGRADQCQRSPSAATRVLDDGISGLQSPVFLGPRNHGQRHPILHAAGGGFQLELHEDLRTIGRNDLAQSNHRCISNGVENVQELSLFPRWAISSARPTRACWANLPVTALRKAVTRG